MATQDYTIHVTPKEGTETVRIIHEPVATRKVHEWNRREYSLTSMQAVVDLVTRKGSTENTVIFYDRDAVRVVLDDTVQDRPQDIAEYQFTLSDQMQNWMSIFSTRLNQRQLVHFLKRIEPSELENVDMLIANVRKLQVVTAITGDYEFDEHGNVSVMYRESNGKEGLMALPAMMEPCLPILNESDFELVIGVELELIKPKADDERPLVVLTCPKMDVYVKEAVAYEVCKLKQLLPEYLILAGSWR